MLAAAHFEPGDTSGHRVSPYVGPRAFATGETLYGRDREIQKLLHLLIAERIVMMYSPSGAGKTSLIQAGLLPRLAEEDFEVLPIIRVGLEPPLATLDGQAQAEGPINRYVLSALLSLEEGRPPEERLALGELASLALTTYLEQRTAAAHGASKEWALLFDQFEEILSIEPTNQSDKTTFFAQLGAALRDKRYWALFALREDYVAGLDPYLRPIPTRLHTTFRLDLLGKDAAREPIQRPAREAGVEFGAAAAERLIDDLSRVRVQHADGTSSEEPGTFIEPVQLQVVCLRLWERLSANATRIEVDDLGSVGNVDEALAGYYAERVTDIAGRVGIGERNIREWVDRRLITEGGLRGQVLQGIDRSEGLPNRAIWALVDAHLVRAESRRGFTWFELAHDRLVAPLRADNAEWQLLRLNEVQRQAALWEQQDRPSGLLLDGAALQAAERWAVENQAELTSVERDFLAASREASERARRQRRTDLGLRILLVLAIAASAVAGFFFTQSEAQRQQAVSAQATAEAERSGAVDARATAEAERAGAVDARATAEAARQTAEAAQSVAEDQARRATSRQLAAASLAHSASQLDLALLLSVEGSLIAQTPEAIGSLHSVLPPDLITYLRGTTQGNILAFSTDSAFLAASGPGPNVVLWDVSTGQMVDPPLAMPGARYAVSSLAFSPDGARLAAGTSNSRGDAASGQIFGESDIYLWNLVSHQPTGVRLTDRMGAVVGLAFSEDGGTLLAFTSDNRLHRFDVAAQAPTEPLSPQDVPDIRALVLKLVGGTLGTQVNGAEFSQDRMLLADTDSGNLLHVLDVPNLQEHGNPFGNSGVFPGAHPHFSPDGASLAWADGKGIVQLWDAAQETVSGSLGNGNPRLRDAVFSPDGALLAAASDDGKIQLWDVGRRRLTRSIATGSMSWSVAMTFSPDGKILATKSAAGDVQLFDTTNKPDTAQRLSAGTGSISGLVFGPDSRTLATAQGNAQGSALNLWDVETGQLLTALAGGLGTTMPTGSLAFNSDGRVALAGRDRTLDGYDWRALTVSVWDPRSQTLVAQLHPADGPPPQLVAPAPTPPTVPTRAPTTQATIPTPPPDAFSDMEELRGPAVGLPSIGIPPPEVHVGFALGRPVLTAIERDGTLYRWDTVSYRALPTLSGFNAGKDSRGGPAVLSPDGTRLAILEKGDSNTDPRVHVWDLERIEDMGDLPIGSAGAYAFSPDNTLLVSGSGNDVRVWSVANRQQLLPPLSGHRGPVRTAVFSADSHMLASGDELGVVRLWDVATGLAIGPPRNAPPTQLASAVTSLAFSPDGARLAAATDKGVVAVWQVSPSVLRAQACRMANRNLTPAEWAQFVADRPYQPTCSGLP